MRRQLITTLTSALVPFCGLSTTIDSSYANSFSYIGNRGERKNLSAVSISSASDWGDLSLSFNESEIHPGDELILQAGQPVSELIVIDEAVPHKHLLYKERKPGVAVALINSDASGLEQLQQELQRYSELDALHIVSHASNGSISLGNTKITPRVLTDQVRFFNTLDNAMKENADVLFYGCELASGEKGEELLQLISGAAHVDVAASTDLTGSEKKGGDWELELKIGEIETERPFSKQALQDFSSILVDYVPSDFCTHNGGACGGYAFETSSDSNLLIFGDGTDIRRLGGFASMIYSYKSVGNTSGYTHITAFGFSSFDLTALSFHVYLGYTCDVTVTNEGGDTIQSFSGVSGDNAITIGTNTSGISGVRISNSNCSPLNSNAVGIKSLSLTPLSSPDSDGGLTSSATVSEPVAIDTTVDSVGEAVDVFDFTLSDGGFSDGNAMTVSQIVLNMSGTASDAQRDNVTWRLNGNDVSNVVGTYNAGADTLTFSGLSISIANGGSETYTVNAYFNDNTGLTEGLTYILSVDGDTDVTVGGGGTQMGTTSPVSNGSGSTASVVASGLVFSTQPAGSVSGANLTTQPVVTAQDAFGNTDTDFTETITLTEGSAGSITGGSVAAVSGVATFTALNYTATGDQESFTLTANDQDGVGTNLSTTNSDPVTSDVVATKLLFTTQPVPTTLSSGQATAFSTVPVVSAVDASNLVDTGYSTNITLSEVNGAGSAVMSVSVTDQDASANTVTVTPSGGTGVSTFTDLSLTYTASGGSNETFNLQASSGGLTVANSTLLTAEVDTTPPTITDANISISGASGTGGAYRVGDTVTASWDNSAGGDNNSDVNSVTIDFSQFGGGSNVVASNSSQTWTATYTITEDGGGSIDEINRNVSVTATDNASNSDTTADTTNATVDNDSPLVTDGNISISGATGTGGAYRIGDTVTASWDNSGSGENNSDAISTVTFNFSDFGGGAAVAATNSSEVWSASYTITSGGIDGSNLNVSATATDNAGNTTTTSDTSNAVLDNINPTVSDVNINISGASGTGGAFRVGDTVTATWNNSVSGDNNGDISSVTVDFSQFGGGSNVVASNSSQTWTATYTITEDGGGSIDEINRNVSVTATDNASNSATTADTTNATVDNDSPLITDGNISISGASGTGGAFRVGDTVTATWDNSVSGDNNGDITSVTVDFSQFGGGSNVVASNSSQTWTATYTITEDGGGSIDEINRNVSVTATDNASNSDTTADTTNATVDNDSPLVTDGNISISGATGTGGAYRIGDTVTASWDNSGSGENNSDTISTVTFNFSDFGGGAAITATNSSEVWSASYTITSGGIDGSNLNVSATATDNAGNTTTTSDTSNAALDNINPTVSDVNITISGASGTGGAFRVGDTVTTTWNNSVSGDNNGDISSVTVDFSQFGGGSGIVASNTSDTWTATYTITEGAGGGIDAVNRNVSVTAIDTVGNSSVTADSTNAVVDTSSPASPTTPDLVAGSDTGISNSDNITSDTTPTFSGSSEGSATVEVTSSVDGLLGSTTADVGGNWSYTPSSNLSVSAHSITALAIDDAGNRSSSSGGLTITIDGISPAVPSAPDMVAITDNGVSTTDNSTSDTTPIFTGTAETDTTVTLISSVDGQVGTDASGSGSWSIAAGTLSYGAHTITARAMDSAGNTSALSAGLSILINHDPVFSGTPFIDGEREVGETLWLQDTETWDADSESVTLSYQWLRDGEELPGATEVSYQLQGDDISMTISCEIEALDASGGMAFFTTSGLLIKGGFPWEVVLPGLTAPKDEE